VSEPQVQDSAAGPVHDEREEDDDEDYHHQPEEEHDDSGNCVPSYCSRSSHGLQLPGTARIIRNPLYVYGASPDGSAAASASQFRSAWSSGSPLVRKVRRAALFTLLIVDLGNAATTVTSCGTFALDLIRVYSSAARQGDLRWGRC